MVVYAKRKGTFEVGLFRAAVYHMYIELFVLYSNIRINLVGTIRFPEAAVLHDLLATALWRLVTWCPSENYGMILLLCDQSARMVRL